MRAKVFNYGRFSRLRERNFRGFSKLSDTSADNFILCCPFQTISRYAKIKVISFHMAFIILADHGY